MTKSFLTIMLNSNNDYSVWQNLSAQGHTSIDAFSLTRKYENEVIIFDWSSDVFIPRGIYRTFFWRDTYYLLPSSTEYPIYSFSETWIKLALSYVGYKSLLSCTYMQTTYTYTCTDHTHVKFPVYISQCLWDSAALFLDKTRGLCFQITKDLALFTNKANNSNYYLEKKTKKLYK